MNRLVRYSDGRPVVLRVDRPLGAGGEARIYEVLQAPDLVAKVYHDPEEAMARKLGVMLRNPPEDADTLLAWPVDLLVTAEGGRTVGFLMPRVSGRRPIFTFYNPAARRELGPLCNYRYLHRTGRNLAAAFRALHRRGYVVGDVNETNILASETALVTLVDCDSFQVRDPQSGVVYRCPVGRPEFTPPELLGADFGVVDRTAEQDRFGLAVLLFQLLMEGTHPFAGIYQGRGDPPPYEVRIRAGHFVYGSRSVPYRPMPSALPLPVLHPTLRQLFLRCFEDGHGNPAARPDAQTWLTALEEAEGDLTVCEINAQHYFGRHLERCPWCERAQQLGGRDPFPSVQDVRAGRHRVSVPRRRAPALPAELSGGVAGVPSVGGGYPSSVPVPASLPDPPQNVWALAAWAFLTAALLPTFRFFVLGALLCGLCGLRTAVRGPGPGRFSSLMAVSGAVLLGGATVLLPLLPKPAGAVRTISGLESAVGALAFSPDGGTVVAGTLRPSNLSGAQAGLLVLDPRAESSRTVATFRGDVNAVAFSPDGRYLAVGFMEPLGEGQVQLWRTADWQRLWERTAHRNAIRAVVFSPDGRTLATGGAFDYVRTREVFAQASLWDVGTGRLQRTLQMKGELNCLAFSPDGRYLIAGTGGGSSTRSVETGQVTLWDVGTGRAVWSIPAHGTTVLAVACSADGRVAASAGNDNAVRLWDLRSGRRLRVLEAGGFWLSSVAFSPDGSTVAAGGSDAVIRLWNVGTGRLVRVLRGHRGVVQSLAYAPDGRMLVSGGRDGTIRVWRLGLPGGDRAGSGL
ncbi:MAG: hypothetical protein RMJ43_05675 [Chloroherpetonaceae bacterium]|nr:hypothetical protein [Chthonomonadaceae bacterium]MDW8207305.1 hypothetical protein [Chloroherpetonaceae bacterium]